MTKQLYEEALADVKKVKQVAEDNAKRAVLEAVTPRIREFIDQALLREHGLDGDGDEDDGIAAPGAPEPQGQLMTDLVAMDPRAAVPVTNAGPAAAITPPDADGKVTLDIDALCSSEPGTPVPAPMFGSGVPAIDAAPETEYEINMESINALQPVVDASKKPTATLSSLIAQITEGVASLKKTGEAIRTTPSFREQIAQMISRVENMYDYVQNRVTDAAMQNSYETMLEASYKDLNKLQELTTMSKKTNKGQMNEADVTLKLTGLPDDIDLDTVGVDLITGEEDEEGQGDQGGDDAGFGDDLDLGGQQGQAMDGEDQMETRTLSDDTIVEIDEKMLRREIARMRKLRENHTATGGSETKAQSWGNGPGGASILDDFGGGDDEGDAHDQEIVDLSPAPGSKPLGEADEDLDEVQAAMDESDDDDDVDDDLDEGYMDEMDQLAQATDGPAHGGDGTTPTNKQSRHPGESFGEAKKRLAAEKKLQEQAKARAAFLKQEAAKAKGNKLVAIKKEYAVVAKRFNESLARSKKITQLVAEATKQQKAGSNSSAARPAEHGRRFSPQEVGRNESVQREAPLHQQASAKRAADLTPEGAGHQAARQCEDGTRGQAGLREPLQHAGWDLRNQSTRAQGPSGPWLWFTGDPSCYDSDPQ
jgi:hypothetical protein